MIKKAFHEKWLEAVDKKNSVLCAGIDPAEFNMHRGEKGLLKKTNKRDWSLKYVEAVAPYCSAIKPNIQYWQAKGNARKLLNQQINKADLKEDDMEALTEIANLANSLELVVIEDKKLADIGSTNDAGMFYASFRADAVTLALYAGNMEEAVKQLKARNLGGIHMCLMTNPEYAKEKNKWVKISDSDTYRKQDIENIRGIPHTRQYKQLAHDAKKFGLDGLVIGTTKHVQEYEIAIAKSYAGDEMLVLLPGIGAQGGDINIIWKYFNKNNVIVNVGRNLILPNGSNSTSKQQAEKAKEYKDMINILRNSINL